MTREANGSVGPLRAFKGQAMTELKLHQPQPHISPARLREKLDVARMYLALTREFLEKAFPGGKGDMEALLVLICIFIGDAEGRSTTATKLASHSGLSRTAVYRRLEFLVRIKKIIRIGDSYHLATGALVADEQGKVSKIINKFLHK